MKRYLFIALLISSSLSMFAEYALINKIVYSLSFDKQEATVLNFQTNSPEVTIPPYITYRGDKYTVTGFSLDKFNTDAYSVYQRTKGNRVWTELAYEQEKAEIAFRYDYDYVRQGIVQVNLPNTIKRIKSNALDGMRKLKTLTIPASIEELSFGEYDCLLHSNHSRLEKVVVLGTPIIYEKSSKVVEDEYYKNGRVKDFVDTITMYSQNEQGEYIYKKKLYQYLGAENCPNLKSFEVPQFDKFMAKIEANRPMFDNYNRLLVGVTKTFRDKVPNSTIEIRTPQIDNATLIDTALMGQGYRDALNYLLARSVYASYDLSARDYKRQLDSALHEHPYYDGTEIDYLLQPIDEMETDAELVKNAFVMQKNNMDEQYNTKINGGMEKNLHDNYPSQYVKSYCSIHPEMKAIADSVAKDYRCEVERRQYRYVIEYIETGKNATASCREKEWNRNQLLFDSREDYDERYNLAKSDKEFTDEIKERNHASFELIHMKNYVDDHIKDIKLSNINKKPNDATTKISNYLAEFKKTYFYDRAVKSLMQSYPKVAKEYEKNKQYFGSETEFFEAYISDSYSAILKNKKKK